MHDPLDALWTAWDESVRAADPANPPPWYALHDAYCERGDERMVRVLGEMKAHRHDTSEASTTFGFATKSPPYWDLYTLPGRTEWRASFRIPPWLTESKSYRHYLTARAAVEALADALYPVAEVSHNA